MFEEPDRVPLFELFISSEVLSNVLGKKLVEIGELGRTTAPVEERVKAHIEVGLDSFCVDTFLNPKNSIQIDEDLYVDEWGRLFSNKIRGLDSDFYKGGYLASPEKYEDFQGPDPCDPWRVKQYVKAVDVAGEDAFIIPGVGSIFEVTAEAVGFENFLKYLFIKPNFVKKVLEHAANFTIEQGKICIDAGAEVCMVFDDYAYKHGPMMSPRHWKEFVFPSLKSVAEAFHKKGAFLLLHSDGDILPLMDMIIEAGVDGIHPLEPTAGIRLDKVKEKWGDKICLIGNIDINKLTLGSPKEIGEDVKKAIKAAAPGGGYILCSGHCINAKCKLENLIAQIKTGKKYGKYSQIKI
jgi:uroporphyrinogen decarboxylase